MRTYRKGMLLPGSPVDASGAFVGNRPVIVHQQRRGAPANEARVDVVGGSLSRLSELIAQRVELVKRLGEFREKLVKAKRP
jgi:hypothetical protein